MSIFDPFLRYLPVLIILTPLVGVMNALIVHLLDRPSVGRTFLPNLCLTASLFAALLFAFDYGPQRSGLYVAESVQFFSQIALPIEGRADRDTIQCAFGIDGLSLPLLAMVVLLPLATYVSEKSESGLMILSLCLQSALLAVVSTLDWRIMCGGLFAAALVLRLILARSLPVSTLRRTSRWSQRTFLGDVLLASGTMYFFLLASNYLQVRGENFSTIIFEMRDFFTRIEHFQELDSERVVELSLATSTAVVMIVCGVLLRLPLLPDSLGGSSPENSSQRIATMWIWLYGPVIVVSFATRIIQLDPETAYACLAPFRWFLIVAILILGLVSCVSQTHQLNQQTLLLPLRLLLGVGLCTPNPSSLAGMYLLLGFLPSMHSALPTSSEADGVRAIPLSAIPVVMGSLMILVGVFIGSGSGARGLLDLLATGTGLTLFVLSFVRSESTRVSLIGRADHPSNTGGEFPAWERDVAVTRNPEHAPKSTKSMLLTKAVLIVGLLILPQQFWQRIRWDVQKVGFPTVASDLQVSIYSGVKHENLTSYTDREIE